MSKFKEGDIVQVTTPGYKAYIGCIGIVVDYIAKDRISVDFGKTIGTIALNECDLVPISKPVYTSTINNVIEAVKPNTIIPNPIVSSTGYGDCLTDPNVDYEALSEEPMYYEFIDIGKALNKLKTYEHCCKTEQPIDMDFKKGETVFFITELKTIGCGLVYSSNIRTVCIEFPTKGASVYDISKVFKTYRQALEYLEIII